MFIWVFDNWNVFQLQSSHLSNNKHSSWNPTWWVQLTKHSMNILSFMGHVTDQIWCGYFGSFLSPRKTHCTHRGGDGNTNVAALDEFLWKEETAFKKWKEGLPSPPFSTLKLWTVPFSKAVLWDCLDTLAFFLSVCVSGRGPILVWSARWLVT